MYNNVYYHTFTRKYVHFACDTGMAFMRGSSGVSAVAKELRLPGSILGLGKIIFGIRIRFPSCNLQT